jgi:hypothetical protein
VVRLLGVSSNAYDPVLQEPKPSLPKNVAAAPRKISMEHATYSAALLLLLLCGAIVNRIAVARRNADIFIRRLPGLDALDEALGRATEMGRPILFSPGFGQLSDMSTYAALAVLEYVVRHAARYNIRVIVPIPYAPVYPVAQAVVREAYAAEDALDRHRPEDVLFLSGDQNAFMAAVAGILLRERIATALYFGSYGYESLLMAETGRRAGAIQVAATDAFFQVPFFLTSCDYTMIGEELYAAGAYLSREPSLLGSVLGQDVGKLLLALITAAGILAALGATLAGSSFNILAGLLGW